MEKNEIKFEPCDEFGSVGGSLQGSINASFCELVEMFGEPVFEGKGDKITTEFVVDYQYYDAWGDLEMGTFSLYDWHYGRDFNDDNKEIEWNVGGSYFTCAVAADFAMKIFRETDARYGYDQACLGHNQSHNLEDVGEVAA
jgi:hypothetical protein